MEQCETVQASYGCLVGHVCTNFCPITLQHFVVLMSMQTDAYLKKRQIGTLLFGWGHWMGVFGGGALRGVHPKKYTCLPKKASWVYYDLGEVGTHLIKSAVLSCR